MLKKVAAVLIALFMASAIASASVVDKSTSTTVTPAGSKVVKTVTKKHFRRATPSTVKTTSVKTTTVTPVKAK